MFHSHTTQRRVYITADKLRLNKLSQSVTHLSRVKPLMTPASAPKLLQMLLAALVSTKSQAAAAANRCQMQAQAGHETARIGFRPPDTIFRLSWQETELWGVTYCSLCTVEEIRHLRERPWGCVILLCETWQKWPWRLTDINLPRFIWTPRFGNNEWKLGEIP
jgi:hypothetical protein